MKIDSNEKWTFEKIKWITDKIEDIGSNELGLDHYDYQIKIVDYDEMINMYTSVGMPTGYHHWSYGKKYSQLIRRYRAGMGLAYEMVINSNPALVYCMEENSMVMQALVIAHAAIGHNSFFKENFSFRQWEFADAIIDYLEFAKNYVTHCELKYGADKVEKVIDACHSLMMYGVDKYTHPPKLSVKEEEDRAVARREYLQSKLNVLWRQPVPDNKSSSAKKCFPEEPQENILYFLEKNAPELPSWKREIIRIVRKIGQYFYPQRQTNVVNEGFATFVDYHIMNRLYEKELLTSGAWLEFIDSHCGIIFQSEYDETINGHQIYNGINPYALGFAIFSDIKRICENPTDEDKEWFPGLANTDWLNAVKFAAKSFKNDSFVLQYLSPKVIRDFRFFSYFDDGKSDHIEITAIHQNRGYEKIRSILASQYDIGLTTPDIEVVDVARRGNRTLTLRHNMINGKLLHEESAKKTLGYIQSLWEFPVELKAEENGRFVKLYTP
ncbi:SpoVR family protein [Patescibacteria group bacterium]